MAVAASESIDGASDATQLEGLVNRTRWPTLGPKHKRPVIAAGFRIVPQLPYPTLAASLRDPVSCPTFCASSSRVITEPLRASPMDYVRRSSSSRVSPNLRQSPGLRYRRLVLRAACQRGKSSLGTRCKVPRIAQVLTRVRSCQGPLNS